MVFNSARGTGMTEFLVKHSTEYEYSTLASLSYNEARMIPRSFSSYLLDQTCLSKKVESDPIWRDQRLRKDYFGNQVLYFTMRQPHSKMRITVESAVQLKPAPHNPIKREQYDTWAQDSPAWEEIKTWLERKRTEEVFEIKEYFLDSPMIPKFEGAFRYAAASFTPGRPVLAATRELMGRIFDEFDYKPGSTNIFTPIGQVYASKSGVCQDFAHFMIACLRSHGLAARYMSGYIESLPRPGQEKLQGADASHAWIAIYVPGLGWIDFDPTNDLIPYDQHITLAWGRDFSDVTPLKGILFGGGENQLTVSVDVNRKPTAQSRLLGPHEQEPLISLN